MPKGVQEKRTEVLENKVDRIWVRNAFFEWTREVIHQWREKAVLLFVPEKFDFQCDLWQDVEHYTLQQAHITVLLIMQLTAKTQLILQDVIHSTTLCLHLHLHELSRRVVQVYENKQQQQVELKYFILWFSFFKSLKY